MRHACDLIYSLIYGRISPTAIERIVVERRGIPLDPPNDYSQQQCMQYELMRTYRLPCKHILRYYVERDIPIPLAFIDPY